MAQPGVMYENDVASMVKNGFVAKPTPKGAEEADADADADGAAGGASKVRHSSILSATAVALLEAGVVAAVPAILLLFCSPVCFSLLRCRTDGGLLRLAKGWFRRARRPFRGNAEVFATPYVSRFYLTSQTWPPACSFFCVDPTVPQRTPQP